MPYKTIQQNFANGELNPKMQGRADVDMYYKSAQKMRDVVTTPYGGFVRRPGSKTIYSIGNGLTSLTGMTATTEITADETHSIDKVADLDLTTYAELSSTGVQPVGTRLVSVSDSLTPSTSTTNYYAWKGYNTIMYAWEWTNDDGKTIVYTTKPFPSVGDTVYAYYEGQFGQVLGSQGITSASSTSITFRMKTFFERYYTCPRKSASDYKANPFYIYTKGENPSVYDKAYLDSNDTFYNNITAIDTGTIDCNGQTFSREPDFDEQKTISIPSTPKNIRRVNVRKISSTQEQELLLVGVVNGENIVLKEFVSSAEEQSFFIDTDSVFSSVYISNKNEQELDLKLHEVELFYSNDSSGSVSTRIIPFVFNNDQSYVIAVTSGSLKIFRNDTLVAQVTASNFTNSIIPALRYTQTADTLIFVHPDLPPQQLVRGADDSSWTLSNYVLAGIPTYDFDLTAPTTANVSATPSELDGVVKITLSASIGTNLVGQYFEGNGGRVKITSQNNTVLTGYTVIGFYSTDTIASGNWTYTTSYEPVWSAARGWPCSVTFHGGRLWFGGSKSRPQTVWGSKVGLFHKFDPTSGYDNDAIEFTLDTSELNRITDLYSQKNLLIFTLGGEFVCTTSYNEPITPNNVNAVKQTVNGSWEKTRPVDIEGTVMFIERKGQGLMAFAASENTTDIYNSANSSLVNSHLIKSPVDIAVERNNLTQQTNYVYIVNDDGTLCVVNLLASQGITGGYTLWKTQGEYKNVCVLPYATYIMVARREIDGSKLYLEKVVSDFLTDGQEDIYLNNENSYSSNRLFGKKVDVFSDGKYIGNFEADETGTITLPEYINGQVQIGDSFRWYVESNFLEIPQLGVGLNRKKRLATMTVRTLDTPELTVNGETQPGGEGIKDIEYYGIGDWSEHPTWIMQEQRPCKVNVMAVQMNVNYQVAGDEY